MRLLKIEIKKVKASGIFWPVLLIPIALSALILLPGAGKMLGRAGWTGLYLSAVTSYAYFFFFIVIAVVMSFLLRVEHREGNWSGLFTLPVERGKVYLVKLLVGSGIILLNVLALGVFICLAGLLKGLPGPVPWRIIIGLPLKAFVLAAPVIGLQYLLSLFISQPLVSIGIGISLGMPAILAVNSAVYWKFYPWTYPMIGFIQDIFVDKARNFPSMLGIALVLFVVLITIGMVYFKRTERFCQ
ncbi:MAG: ABC transporter permease [Halanaerobium sp.]|nr:ABC transporter permease [Halanaerobium sp.]